MKICHFSDSHLGAGDAYTRRGSSGLTVRQEDIINAFISAIDKIIEIRPSLCIHSGDLFHSVRPLNRVMAIAASELTRLARDAGIPTVMIAGNHDAPRQVHVGAAIEVFRQIENLYICAGGHRDVFTIGDCHVVALPHCLTTTGLQEELGRCMPDESSRFNVFVAHGVAAGMPEFSMADLGEQEIGLDMMKPFDYTALGHFHNYCQVAPRAWYAGSTERITQSERDSAKGFVEVDLEPFRVVFHEVQSRTMIDLPVINAAGKRGDQVAEAIRAQVGRVNSSDKIVRVTVQGVTEETLRTLPADLIADLKRDSFSLNVRLERAAEDDSSPQFGRSGIGQLDEGFIQFLDVTDLKGFDRERLKKEALKYLADEE